MDFSTRSYYHKLPPAFSFQVILTNSYNRSGKTLLLGKDVVVQWRNLKDIDRNQLIIMCGWHLTMPTYLHISDIHSCNTLPQVYRAIAVKLIRRRYLSQAIVNHCQW